MFNVIRLAPIATPFHLADYDVVTESSSKTAASFADRRPNLETGKDRLYAMYTVDEFGTISPEINSVYQTAFVSFLTGAVYGGFIQSRGAYMEFMENNQATAFKSHLDAKKKLQDQVTVNFAKGAVRWGWRLSMFTTTYVGIATTISVYRGKSSIYEYLAAGLLTGSMYKVNGGLRGMTVGGLLGCGLGGLAGICSLLVLKASGKSMEEVRYWQYNWKRERDMIEMEADLANSISEKDPLLEQRGNRYKENTLKNVDLDGNAKSGGN
ncbi:RPII140-upstream gene protein [Bradysia coprophila]|uniref:RPII140-upstream gene protein n=1 Tax=Bradysia coprophila TaxID=38358 RepID=UPI00187D97E1|nr:RPII140-upstream gene protein [Bradysia coprophila]